MSRINPTPAANGTLAGLGLAGIVIGVLATLGLSLYHELGVHGMSTDAPLQAARAMLSSIHFRG